MERISRVQLIFAGARTITESISIILQLNIKDSIALLYNNCKYININIIKKGLQKSPDNLYFKMSNFVE